MLSFGGKFTKISVGRSTATVIFFKTVTTTRQLLSSFFCRGQSQFFGKNCEEESVGQTGGQTLLHSCSYYLTFVWTVLFI